MRADLGRVPVAVAGALLVSALVWYVALTWSSWLAGHYAGDQGVLGRTLGYLPGWTTLIERLLPGFIVGLIATRGVALTGALTAWAFALGVGGLSYVAGNYGMPSSPAGQLFEIGLGRALPSLIYGAIAALAARSLRERAERTTSTVGGADSTQT